MNAKWLVFGLGILVGCTFAPLTLAQDDKAYNEARTAFEKAMKASDWPVRSGAMRRMKSTGDPRAVKDLRASLNKVRSTIEDVRKKLDPLTLERGKISEELAKRTDPQGRLFVGAAGNLPKKFEEVSAKIAPLEASLRIELDSRRLLIATIGELVTALPAADQDTLTAEMLGLIEKLKNEDDKFLYIEILSFVRNPQSSAGLAGVVMNSLNPALRVRSLDALARLGDSSAAAAVVHSLEDEYWQVRTAAINALQRFGSVDAIPQLITRMEKEDGRLKDDILKALTSMTGVTFHDNLVIWKDWWTKNSEQLKTWAADVVSENSVSRSTALDQSASAGFLLAFRLALDKRGLSLNAVRDQEAERRTDPEAENVSPGGAAAGGVEAADQELESLIEAVGRAIGSREPPIAQAALESLLVQPYVVSKDAGKRTTLLRAIGSTGTKAAAEFLAGVIKSTDTEKPRGRAEKLAAVTAMGLAARENEHLDVLLEVFREKNPETEILSAAAAALAEVGTLNALTRMMMAFSEVDAATGQRKARLDCALPGLLEGLKKLTRADAGATYTAWNGWWQKNKKDFKTTRDEELAKNPELAVKRADDTGGTTFYGIKTYSKRLCFVLDVSGSMNEPAEYAGGTKTKIQVAREELSAAILSLPDDAWFNIVFYSSSYKIWKKTMVQATADIKKEAKTWVDGVEASGSTNIYDSLVKAFELAGRGSFDKQYETQLDTLFFLSDGQPTAGRILDPNIIRTEILQLNTLKKIRIHAIGVGRDHDRAFMESLARETGGQYLAR